MFVTSHHWALVDLLEDMFSVIVMTKVEVSSGPGRVRTPTTFFLRPQDESLGWSTSLQLGSYGSLVFLRMTNPGKKQKLINRKTSG